MKTSRLFLSLAAAGILALAPSISRGEAFTKAEISQIFNEVKTLDTTGARPSKIRETIAGEQSVKTGMQSRAELTFPDKSLTRLGGNTIFSFQQGTRELELKQGTLLFEVPKGKGGAKIRTAAITAAITGTTGFYEYSPKAGPDGVIKFGILEGSATLFIRGRLGHFITVGPGQMVICPANLRDFNSTEVVYFEIEDFLKTCALINRMGGLPQNSLLLVERAIAEQGRRFNRTKELYLTNLLIPGGGTEVIITDINQRFTANNPLLTPPPLTPPPRHNHYNPPPPNVPGGTGAPSSPSKYGPLQTITSSNPYVINSGTQILSDPLITTNGVTDRGYIYRGAAVDGALTNYQFGSTSTFDGTLGYGTTYAFPVGGIANFKFENLVITGQPTLTINGGPSDVALISEGTITSAAPGGTFNLDAFDGLFLGTVNGSITLGPELTFTSSLTGVTPDSYDNNNNYLEGPYLEIYARGASSDVLFGSTVNFTGNRGLRLEAENNVEISGNINTSFLGITAGNDFILDSTAQVTASTFKIYDATNVQGNGLAFVSTNTADITLQDSLTLSLCGNFLKVNTLPLDASALQNLTVTSGMVSVANDISSVNFQNLTLNSTSCNLVINGAISASNFSATAPDLTAGEGSSLTANSAYLNLYNATAQISQEDLLTVQGLPIYTNSLNYLTVQANQIQINTDLNLGASDSNLNGTYLSLDGYSSITASGSIYATNVQLYGQTTVTGSVTSDNDLTFSNLTAGGAVSANTISAAGFTGNAYTLTASSINAPGGLQNFNGYDGYVSATNSYAPAAGATLTLTATAAPIYFGTPGGGGEREGILGPPNENGVEPGTPAIGGTTSLNGGNAPANSLFAGGNGGSLTVISAQGITVAAPISATTGANGNGVVSGGAGGSVNLQSSGGPICVSSSIDVSSNNPGAQQVSASGGSICIQSGSTNAVAIKVTNSGVLRSLLNAAAPGPGGVVRIVATSGGIVFNGTAQADRGTVDIHSNGTSSMVCLNNANISADVVKIGALGCNGVLSIGGGTISANSQMALYAGGSNGTINFVNNVALSGNGTKAIAANTININSGKQVTITGGAASIYTNNANFQGAGGTGGKNGSFVGSGVPASYQALSAAPHY